MELAYVKALFSVFLLFAGFMAFLRWRASGFRLPRFFRFPSRAGIVDTSDADPLVVALLGDTAAADRLMRHELDLDKNLDWREARRKALERLTRDRAGGYR